MAQQILRQGEIFLNATLTVASSIDQRASTLASIFSASATAALAAAAAIHISDKPDPILVLSAVAIAITWFIGAGLCVWVLLPTKYDLPGNHPQNWWRDEVRLGPLIEAIGGETENYQDKIDFNVAALKSDGLFLRMGTVTGCSAPAVGFLIWNILT